MVSHISLNNTMKQYKHNLGIDDLTFFYQILYQFEKECSHCGYDYSKVIDKVKSKINLIHDTKKKKISFSMPQAPNNLVLKSNGNVSSPLVKQVRNAFAHALIEVEADKYIINKELNPKCKLCGIVEKDVFKEFIKAIQSTRS